MSSENSELHDLSFETCPSPSTEKNNEKPKAVLKTKRRSLRKSLYQRATVAASDKKRSKNAKQETAKPLVKSSTTTKLTIPVTPEFRRSTRSSTKALSSEDLEIQKVQDEIKQRKKRKSVAIVRLNKAKSKGSSTFQSTLKSSEKRLTVPKTPTFAKRKGKLPICSVDDNELSKKKVYTNVLTSKSVCTFGPTSSKPKMSVTIPKPFKLKTTERIGEPLATYTSKNAPSQMSSAEINANFFNKSRNSNHATKNDKSSQSAQKTLTIPASPSFRSKFGTLHKVMSRDEQEELEMQEFEKKAFKAKPVNKKILKSMGVMGVPKVEVKKATIPTEFKLKIDARASSRKSMITSPIIKENSFIQFKAQPMPNTTPVVSNSAVTKKSLTEPMSPKLHGGRASSAPTRRQRSRTSMIVEQPPSRTKATKVLTQPKEFILKTSSRGSIHQDNFNKQMQRELELEKAAHEVKATPITIPTWSRSDPAPSAVTIPQGFNLRSESRHSIAQDNFQKEIAKAEETKKKQTNSFHAKELPKTTFEPSFLKAAPEQKKKVYPIQKELESDKRASARKEYDNSIAKRNEQLDQLRESLKIHQAEKENEKVKELRSKPISEGGLMFKAAPVLKDDLYKAPAPKAKKLTEPKSPNLQYGKTPRHSVAAAAIATM